MIYRSTNATDPIGALQTVIQLRGYAYLAGGLLFGVALYGAHVLARWATALLAVGGVVSVVLSLMPDAFYRLLAFPKRHRDDRPRLLAVAHHADGA